LLIRCEGGGPIRPISASRVRSKSILSLLLALMALAAPVARAESAGTPAETRRARELYREGKEAYAAGRFVEAYDFFDQGFRLSGRALFLLNMAQAKRRAGALDDARTLCRRFLELEPQSPHRADVEALLREVEGAMGAAAPPPIVTAAPPAVVLAPAPPVETPSLVVRRQEVAEPPPPVYKRWWIWAAGGAAVAALATGLLLASGNAGAHGGSLGTLGAP
jgi:tetratricopeptide (TPR) repeat protein